MRLPRISELPLHVVDSLLDYLLRIPALPIQLKPMHRSLGLVQHNFYVRLL